MKLEKLLIDCCEERSQISEGLSENVTTHSRVRHEDRMGQLFLEIRALWWEYQILAKPNDINLNIQLVTKSFGD